MHLFRIVSRSIGRGCGSVLCAGVLLGLPAHASAAALAHSHLHPRDFALSASYFPAGSRIMRAGVESNRQLLLDDRTHFGLPPAAVKRETGYYMDALASAAGEQEGDSTSYLVSIFPPGRQARIAYDVRWNEWFDASYYTTPPPPPVRVGARGEEALFHTFYSDQTTLSELLFRRGCILVEVFQKTGATGPAPQELRSFYAIAVRLDQLAQKHPSGE